MNNERDLHMTLRRSRATDACAIEKLRRISAVSPDFPPTALFQWKTAAEFESLIERSVLCITAISTITGEVAGFICLNDTPHAPGIPGDRWEKMLHDGEYNGKNGMQIAPYNTLWVKSVVAPPSSVFHQDAIDVNDSRGLEMRRKLLLFQYSSEDILRRLLFVALTNSSSTAHLLVPLPMMCSYKPLESLSVGTIPLSESHFNGSLLHLLASQLVTQLHLRLGIVEDYDDFVPKILEKRGLITALPADFFLDEILKDQDIFHKVITAEDTGTHQVVGLMCLEASCEDQQALSRQYATEVFGKFRSFSSRRSMKTNGNANAPNVVKIYFFQMDPEYALFAGQFLPFLFQQFPFAEYATIILPYNIDEPPLLRHFENIPIRKYQPRNAKGDTLMPPEGLWVTCRCATEPLEALPISATTETDCISCFLDEPLPGFSQEHKAALLEDLGLKFGTIECKSPHRDQSSDTPTVVVLMSYVESEESPIVVGVASARKTTVDEMYALRANYDLDMIVNYYTEEPRDYSATDVSLTPVEGRRKFFRQEMHGILVRSFYIRPTYRCHIQFFLREILRCTNCEVSLVLEDSSASPFTPLLQQLIRIQPRRVQEKVNQGNTFGPRMSLGTGDNLVDGKDIAALGCLFACTRRVLGDRKKVLFSRVIVVGAGSTGLAFIHRLLAVPYVCFVNIVLISTDGMPVHPNQRSQLWHADHMELLEREHMGLIVGNPIRVVYGSVVDVETNQRYVSIDDGTYEPYDYVILTTGRQYVVPSSIYQLLQSLQPYRPRGFVPTGTIALSGESAIEKIQQHLSDLDRNPHNISNVVVYGSGLDAFAIVTFIANFGFSPQRIVVVSPDLKNPFVDGDVFDCVVKMWNSLGTNILRGYQISRMEYDDEGNTLTNVVISPVVTSAEEGSTGAPTGASNSVELSCSLIICCEDKDIDSHVLSTLNRHSIVFDGRVVVEANYRTTNERVYAAGPVAMFTRRYGTTASFDEFNARDVGTNMAEVMLGILGFEEYAVQNVDTNDTKEEAVAAAQNELYTKVLEENGSRSRSYHMDATDLAVNHDSREAAAERQLQLQKNLPAYSAPLVNRIRLPGNYIFFCCSSVAFKPELCLRLCYSSITENRPSVSGILDLGNLPSPNAQSDMSSIPQQNLLAIYVDKQTHYIDAVVYFGNGDPEMYHYMCLIGMPQSLLNLLYRYGEALPSAAEGTDDQNKRSGGLNLMEYLRIPKLQVLFYDRFGDFFRQLRQKMRAHEENENVKARVLAQLHEGNTLDEETRTLSVAELTAQRSSFALQVQYELIKFLHEHKDYLPQIHYLPDISTHVKQKNQS